jgi:ABC-2 type transport system permease protein
MRAELVKLRVLPTPRVMLAVALGLGVIVGVGLAIDSPSDPGNYSDAALAAATTVTSIASIVLGVWMVGMEYGQGTMRRVVATVPARTSILRAKLVVLIACVVLGTIAVYALDWVMAALAGQLAGQSVPFDPVLAEAGGALVGNIAYAVVGFSVALLTRSMAGGITITLVLALVVDTLLSTIPTVGGYSFGASITDLVGTIRGDADAEMWGRGLAVTLGWLLVFSVVSWLRFARQDVK